MDRIPLIQFELSKWREYALCGPDVTLLRVGLERRSRQNHRSVPVRIDKWPSQAHEDISLPSLHSALLSATHSSKKKLVPLRLNHTTAKKQIFSTLTEIDADRQYENIESRRKKQFEDSAIYSDRILGVKELKSRDLSQRARLIDQQYANFYGDQLPSPAVSKGCQGIALKIPSPKKSKDFVISASHLARIGDDLVSDLERSKSTMSTSQRRSRLLLIEEYFDKFLAEFRILGPALSLLKKSCDEVMNIADGESHNLTWIRSEISKVNLSSISCRMHQKMQSKRMIQLRQKLNAFNAGNQELLENIMRKMTAYAQYYPVSDRRTEPLSEDPPGFLGAKSGLKDPMIAFRQGITTLKDDESGTNNDSAELERIISIIKKNAFEMQESNTRLQSEVNKTQSQVSGQEKLLKDLIR